MIIICCFQTIVINTVPVRCNLNYARVQDKIDAHSGVTINAFITSTRFLLINRARVENAFRAFTEVLIFFQGILEKVMCRMNLETRQRAVLLWKSGAKVFLYTILFP